MVVNRIEYEVVEIKPLPDGKRFQVAIKSPFHKDIFGEPKIEYYTFPMKELQNDRWRTIIDRIILRRAADEEEREQAGITEITTMKQKIEEAKAKHIGKKVDLTQKYQEVKEHLVKKPKKNRLIDEKTGQDVSPPATTKQNQKTTGG